MMKMWGVLGLLLLGPWLLHDVAVARFRISETDAGLQLSIVMDANDLASVLEVPLTELDTVQLRPYLSEHLSILVNDRPISYTFTRLQWQQDHIRLAADIDYDHQPVRQLVVNNSVLLGIEGQSNILELDLNGESRDFRMHLGRQQISTFY